jgi:hypothetical protein
MVIEKSSNASTPRRIGEHDAARRDLELVRPLSAGLKSAGRRRTPAVLLDAAPERHPCRSPFSERFHWQQGQVKSLRCAARAAKLAAVRADVFDDVDRRPARTRPPSAADRGVLEVAWSISASRPT